MIVAAYERPRPLACLLHSFLCQTYENFEVLIIHDGPGAAAREVVERIGDRRIKFMETDRRTNQFGHPLRKLGIGYCSGQYVGMSNDDNYYVPVYFEWMLHSLVASGALFAYCNTIHSHHLWQPYDTKPMRGALDAGAWIADTELVKTTEWTDFGSAGDGTYIDALVAKAQNRIVKVPGYVFVHN